MRFLERFRDVVGHKILKGLLPQRYEYWPSDCFAAQRSLIGRIEAIGMSGRRFALARTLR